MEEIQRKTKQLKEKVEYKVKIVSNGNGLPTKTIGGKRGI
jgi:hypothetical protein